ncbi:MAG: patatin-like phospholipase family protein [Verrucomicrobia bacterium]|nr:patatin-like phospholipase family protein [Verrucomicrobiota bacterium]
MKTMVLLLRSFLLRAAATCGVAAFLAGCCTPRDCGQAQDSVEKYQLGKEAVYRVLAAPAGPASRPIDVLILSGGGSHGAWGAGVLRGWRENPGNPRPAAFRVVTGVSTGALLATFAFLGEPGDDEVLERAYTTLKTSDIYRRKFLVAALFSDSLYRSSPLRRQICKHITPEVLERVARIARHEHRQLLAGTVNLDSGRLVVWDLTAIAMDEANSGRLDLYRDVVLASASIPIMVPPVPIAGQLYADGGARAQLFFEGSFLPTMRRVRPAGHPPLTFHVVVNGKIGVAARCVSDCLPDIAMRTLEMLLDANAIGNLYQVKSASEATGFGALRLCSIPRDFPVTASDVFDPAMMRKLYDQGREFGRTALEWPGHIPDPDFE